MYKKCLALSMPDYRFRIPWQFRTALWGGAGFVVLRHIRETHANKQEKAIHVKICVTDGILTQEIPFTLNGRRLCYELVTNADSDVPDRRRAFAAESVGTPEQQYLKMALTYILEQEPKLFAFITLYRLLPQIFSHDFPVRVWKRSRPLADGRRFLRPAFRANVPTQDPAGGGESALLTSTVPNRSMTHARERDIARRARTPQCPSDRNSHVQAGIATRSYGPHSNARLWSRSAAGRS